MNKLVPLSLMGALIIYSVLGIKQENINIGKKLNKTANVIHKQNKKTIKNAQLHGKQEEKKEEMHYETENTVQNPPIEQKEEEIQPIEEPEPKIEDNSFYETRLTSYYPNDGPGTGSVTGSGLGPSNFEVNDKGWFTYQGKLVIATATDYLISRFGLTDGVHTYKYYNELVLNIDGVDYQAIILDSCGNCMRTGRIDLFVSGSWAVKDTTIEVKE